MAEEFSCLECSKALTEGAPRVQKLKRFFCGDCWLHHCEFRFRKRLFELGRGDRSIKLADRLLSDREVVLLDSTYTTSSWALLNLIKNAAKECCYSGKGSDSKAVPGTRSIPLPFSFMVVHFLGRTIEVDSSLKNLQLLRTWQQEAWSETGVELPIVVVSDEAGLCMKERAGDYIKIVNVSDNVEDTASLLPKQTDDSLNQGLEDALKSFKSQSSAMDLKDILRKRALLRTAELIGATKVLVPEDQSFLAIRMFSIMSLGRGLQLADNMNLTTTYGQVNLSRPLMDLTAEDLSDFMRCYELSKKTSIDDSSNLNNMKKTKALQQECAQFITELQSGYPSTVPTLTRIGAKLKPPSEKLGSGDCCSFCLLNAGDSDQGICYGCSNLLRDSTDPSHLQRIITSMDESALS